MGKCLNLKLQKRRHSKSLQSIEQWMEILKTPGAGNL